MSEPNYSEILSFKYSEYEWVIRGNDYKAIVWSAGNSILIPSQKELDDLWPEVESAVATDKAERSKGLIFQGKYPLQDQSIITARAVQTGDSKELNDMLAAWDGL